MKRTLYQLLYYLPLMLLSALLVLLADIYHFAQSPLLYKQTIDYVLPAGFSLRQTVHDLAQHGILRQPRYRYYFLQLAKWNSEATVLKAGEYRITGTTTAQQFLQQLAAGKVLYHEVLFVEGWTFAQFLQAMHAKEYLQHDLLLPATETVMQQWGDDRTHPEGLFFPDTYHVTRGTTESALLQQAYQQMQVRLQDAWQHRAAGLPYRNPYEALIMASLVEKETGLPQEKPQVAGVFIRRLQQHMPLQCDPTVIYGLGNRFSGQLRRADLRDDTPYNTYRHRGLPPTPIAMPGADALHAALHPQLTQALYFVARGDGSHVFSTTLAAHRLAVARYRARKR